MRKDLIITRSGSRNYEMRKDGTLTVVKPAVVCICLIKSVTSFFLLPESTNIYGNRNEHALIVGQTAVS